jgi:hypothetical protein
LSGINTRERAVLASRLEINLVRYERSFVLCLSIIGLLGAVSCGEPLESAVSYDSPLLSISGYIVPFPPANVVSARIGVTWVDPLGVNPDVPMPPETLAYVPTNDGNFLLRLFAPPPATTLRDLPPSVGGADAARFAFGEFVLYDDVNEDATYAVAGPSSEIVAPDTYRGGGGNIVVIYVARASAPDEGPPALRDILSGPIGYHLGVTDCVVAVPSVTTSDAAAVLVYAQSTASTTLPYSRSCLRSHYVPLTGP